jgi:HPt (histidine-containing phosphotransfer) domain-containing protein
MSAQVVETIFDREVALSNVDGDAALLKEIATLFLGEYPTDLQALRDAVARGDAELAERKAHALKGSVSNFGSRAARKAASEIEDLGRARKLAEAAPALDQLETALAALRRALESL